MSTMLDTQVTPITPVVIYGNEIKPAVGSYILLGDNLIGERLLPGDDFCDGGYRGCQFRLPTPNGGPIKSVAVDVHITGRTLQRRNGALYVKVKVVFVGDCEPDTNTAGWMLVN